MSKQYNKAIKLLAQMVIDNNMSNAVATCPKDTTRKELLTTLQTFGTDEDTVATMLSTINKDVADLVRDTQSEIKVW